MSKDLCHMTIDVAKDTKVGKKLLSMHRDDAYSFASNVFTSDYRVATGIDDFANIKVVGYEKVHGSEILIKVRFSVKDCQPEQGQLTKQFPINKTITIHLSKVNDETLCNIALECFQNRTAYSYDGFWWSVKAVDNANGNEVSFTLTNPCSTITDWELLYKPAPKVEIHSDLITSEPAPEPKQPDIVYIAGAISGDVVANRHRFLAAKHSIMASSTNTTVLTPSDLPVGLTESQYMSICLPMVMMSTSLFMLKGWEKSEGAVAEHALAQKLKIEIVYQGEHDGKL